MQAKGVFRNTVYTVFLKHPFLAQLLRQRMEFWWAKTLMRENTAMAALIHAGLWNQTLLTQLKRSTKLNI